jgi:hypothetical protein
MDIPDPSIELQHPGPIICPGLFKSLLLYLPVEFSVIYLFVIDYHQHNRIISIAKNLIKIIVCFVTVSAQFE